MDGSLYYVHSDLLGSTVAVSDAAGGEVGRVQYDPYGEILTSTLPADLTDRLFTGARFDGTIGLYQMGARWYDPALGRWIQPDTIVPDYDNPQALNRYTYVYNNPLRYTDPSGHQGEEDSWLRAFRRRFPPPSDVAALWDPYYSDCVNARDRQAAEQAFLHFLNDPLYFTTLYTDPEAWRTSDEVAALDVFMMYSVFHITAENLVSAGFDPHVADYLSLAHFHRSIGDESGTDYFLALAGVTIPELIKAAEEDYPKLAGREHWHHYTPKYLGGDPKGPQYRIPAPYHQYITNEFQQLWRYKNPAGKPDPVHLQEIMRQVYQKYPIPPGSERR